MGCCSTISFLPYQASRPLFVVGILLLDALGAVRARCGALLVEIGTHWAMNLFFEDGFCLNSLELSLEVLGNVDAGVAAATWVRHAEGSVVNFVSWEAPVGIKWLVV
jgi:hypothetical protein